MDSAAFIFPAVKGCQAKRDYYSSMVPLEVIPRIFQFVDEELPPEIRSQRILNKTRIPEMRDYILNNPDSYVFSSITVSVDGELSFEATSAAEPLIGHITIPMNARFLINDGQHRRAAIAEAIRKNPSLKNEHISVVFYRDEGLCRSQQMFSDLNKYAIRPTKSINILFNSREESAIIAKEIIESVSVFKGLTEKEQTKISNRAKALFTLSAICTATEELLKDNEQDVPARISLAQEYWESVASNIPLWIAVKKGELRSSDIRKDYICSLSLTLVALGQAGHTLIAREPTRWKSVLSILQTVDWHKKNSQWNDLVFINGRVASNRSTQIGLSKFFERLFLENIGEQ